MFSRVKNCTVRGVSAGMSSNLQDAAKLLGLSSCTCSIDRHSSDIVLTLLKGHRLLKTSNLISLPACSPSRALQMAQQHRNQSRWRILMSASSHVMMLEMRKMQLKRLCEAALKHLSDGFLALSFCTCFCSKVGICGLGVSAFLLW